MLKVAINLNPPCILLPLIKTGSHDPCPSLWIDDYVALSPVPGRTGNTPGALTRRLSRAAATQPIAPTTTTWPATAGRGSSWIGRALQSQPGPLASALRSCFACAEGSHDLPVPLKYFITVLFKAEDSSLGENKEWAEADRGPILVRLPCLQ